MSERTEGGNQFDGLLATIAGLQTHAEQTLAKALPADGGEGEGDKGGEADDGGKGDGDDARIEAAAAEGEDAGEGEMTKSFKFVDAEGKEHEGIDATELLKAFDTRLKTVESLPTDVAKLFGAQTTLIKSLIDQVGALATQGKGRKAVLSVADPKKEEDLTKAEQPTVTPDQFFAKAFEAQKAGRISASDISLAEGYLNRRQPVPEAIMRAVYPEMAGTA